jgi:spermidine synthase
MFSASNKSASKNLILFGFGLSGAAALIYEVVWFRALSLILGSTTYALSTMLSAFMSGLALGSFLGGKLADRVKNPIAAFGFLELGIAIFGLLTLPIIRNLSPLYAWIFYTFHLSFSGFSIAQFILAFLVMLIPTTLMGATFPVVLKSRADSLNEIGTDSGEVYSVNTLGSVIGSMSAGFLLIPLLGSTKANLLAASLNFIVALIILGGHRAFPLGILLFISAGLVSQTIPEPIRPFNYYYAFSHPSLKSFYEAASSDALIFKKEDENGLVQVFEKTGGGKFLVNSGKIESLTRGLDAPNLYLLAYLPAAYHNNPKTFLNIGLGTGTTVKAAAEIETLKQIDSVEISSTVLETVRENFYPELFKTRKVRFVKADARNYLFLTRKKYDVISSEPSYPTDESVSHLFTKEFFELVKSRLSKNGVFAQWVPLYLLQKEEMDIMVKTFAAVFPKISLWKASKTAGGDYILIGGNNRLASDVEKIKKNVSQKFKAENVSQYGPTDFIFVSNKFPIKLMKDSSIPLNTDDKPLLSFVAAKNRLK